MQTIRVLGRGVAFAAAMLFCVGSATAAPTLLIIYSGLAPPTAQMMASGLFSTIDTFDASTSNPTQAFVNAHDTILAATNTVPFDGVALGNLLGNAVDAGKHVTVATYALSQPWWISGKMQTHGYSPLVNVNTNGDVSGNLVATVPGDPIFTGVNLSTVTYFHNSNFAHATLDPGATLLATDGAGVNMIARSASGRVVALNLYVDAGEPNNNAEFYTLVARAVAIGAGTAPSATIPTLSEWALLALAFLLVASAGWTLRRRSG